MTKTSDTRKNYVFTPDQLCKLLDGAIGMFIEYRDVHERTEDQARPCAINEMLEGLDAERDLFEQGLLTATSQVLEKDDDDGGQEDVS